MDVVDSYHGLFIVYWLTATVVHDFLDFSWLLDSPEQKFFTVLVTLLCLLGGILYAAAAVCSPRSSSEPTAERREGVHPLLSTVPSLYGSSKLQGQVEFQEDVTVLCAVPSVTSHLSGHAEDSSGVFSSKFQLFIPHPAPKSGEWLTTCSGVRNFGFWHKIGKMEQK